MNLCSYDHNDLTLSKIQNVFSKIDVNKYKHVTQAGSNVHGLHVYIIILFKKVIETYFMIHTILNLQNSQNLLILINS